MNAAPQSFEDPPPEPQGSQHHGSARQPASSRPTPAVPSPTTATRRGCLRRGCLVALVFLALLTVDQFRPPADQVSARVLLAGIDLYQATASKAMPGLGVQCRFQPTCSHYAEGAIRKKGAVRGSLAAVGRIARCGPWTPAGTVDPP